MNWTAKLWSVRLTMRLDSRRCGAVQGWHFAVHTQTFTKGRSIFTRSTEMDLPFHNRLAFTGEGPALLLRPSHCSSQAFISNLPYGKSTVEFSSADASGSTSQAANILEAIEVGASVLLIDEVPFPDPPLAFSLPFPDPPVAFSLPAGHRRDQLHDTERGDATTGGQRQRTDHPVHCQGSAFGPPGQCPPPPLQAAPSRQPPVRTWSGTPIWDTSCCCHPLTGVPYLRSGPRTPSDRLGCCLCHRVERMA